MHPLGGLMLKVGTSIAEAGGADLATLEHFEAQSARPRCADQPQTLYNH
jgi:hypothetical protein